MTYILFYLIKRDHFRFHMEGTFVFPVIYLRRSLRQDQYGFVPLQKRHGFRDHSRLHPQRFCGLMNRCGGIFQFDDMIQKALAFQICLCFLQ